jgi:hypothetical protein
VRVDLGYCEYHFNYKLLEVTDYFKFYPPQYFELFFNKKGDLSRL